VGIVSNGFSIYRKGESELFDKGKDKLKKEVLATLEKFPKREGFEERLKKTGVRYFLSIEDMGNLCPVNGIFSFATSFHDTGANKLTPVLLAKVAMTGAELFDVIQAVQKCRITCGMETISNKRYPLFRYVLAIEDRPGNPFLMETLADVANFDLQKYAIALADVSEQHFVLYAEDDSMATHIKVTVGDQYREIYWKVLLNTIKAYGSDLRPMGNMHAASMEYYQCNSTINMPATHNRLSLA